MFLMILMQTRQTRHLVQVGFSVAAQRHVVQVRLGIFDAAPDHARLGGRVSLVGGEQFHLDLPNFLVMR